MDELEISKGILQKDVRLNVRNHIQIQYEISFEDFLKENYLADEVFYINLIDKNQKEIIAEYEKIINFHDISEGGAFTDDIADQWYSEKITRDNYWYYKEYQIFLKERLAELEKTKKIEKTEMQLFFENLRQYDSFEQTKKIYDFTDNFKPYLFKSFITAYEKYVNGLSSNPFEDDDLEPFTLTVPFNGAEIVFNYNKVPNMIVMSNLLFMDQLNEILKNIENTNNPEPEPLDLPKTSAVEKPFFINEFDTVQESKIIEYFTKNLVDKKYISVEVLNNYLKQAFELKTAPKQKFSFENINTKENIVSIFYKYYKETAAKPHGKQQMYLDLLKIYFSGFEKINIRNFSK